MSDLRVIIQTVWEQIAPDIYDGFDRVTLDVAIDACLDSDRLEEVINKDSDKLVINEFRRLPSEKQESVARDALRHYF